MATAGLLIALAHPVQAQQDDSQASEVYLSFQYRGVVSVYVTTYYKNGQFYLPVSELFNVLQINHNIDQANLTVSGTYLGETEYVFDFHNTVQHQSAKAGDTEISLQAEDYMIKEIDYFVKPYIFEELFGLKFTTDFNNLTLDLETEDKMPVYAQYEREQEREKINRDQPLYDRSYYPLQYDRHFSNLDGTFIDYNLSGVYSQNSQLFTFSNAIGAELLAGDVQGNLFGAFSGDQSTFTTNGLRWRYVQRDNNFFSSAIVGQTNSEGITSRSMTGIKISNKPVEPRLLFDRYVIDGEVPPQSEVELYLNNRLVDYTEADQGGNYRFVVPLTYGSTNYSVRMFTPSGRQIERSSRIQIPFDYIPAGQIDYSLSGGRLSNPILGSTERGYVGEASVSAGLTKWLTAQASTEYLTDYHTSMPSFTGTLNARLFSNYLVSANINSENFYRITSSVVYGSGASWNLSYDYNPGNSRLYNVGGNDHQARFNLFTPFQIGELPLNIRWATTYQRSGISSLFRYRADLNTRLGRLNVRFGYQDQQAGNLQLITTSSSRLRNSYTYSLGRYNSIPKLLRGMFIRGNISYLPGLEEFEEMEFQLSKNIMETGRLQLSFGHNFLGDFNSLSLNFTLDFNKIRSNTTTRSTGSEYSVTQSFRGSLGYDPYGDQVLLNNRQQVGQSGIAVRLFVDNNNDGVYQDSTDNVITDPAVRLNRSGGRTIVKNGINYITQLLPYYRYDIEINKGALSNPLLVPNIENFSIVTDPNQYKTIEIPFYQSGVLSGLVERKRDSTREGLSGVRLYLESNYEDSSNRNPHREEIRTFSDGSFYTYEVPPGKYNLFIDPNQLEFLKVNSQPDTLQLEVQSLAQGDFIEGLNFTVVPKTDTVSAQKPLSKKTTKVEPVDTMSFTGQELYQIQLGSFSTIQRAENYAQTATNQLKGSFNVIHNTFNDLYAVRSILMGNRNEAIETIISYHNSGNYSDAALVVIQPNGTGEQFIQIGAFRSMRRAKSFAALSRIKLGREISVKYKENIGFYKVFLSNSEEQSIAELKKTLAKIRSEEYFSDAFIYIETPIDLEKDRNIQFAYQVQIKGVTEESEQAFLSSITDPAKTKPNKPKKDLIIFDQVTSWADAQEFQRKLQKVSSIGHPIVVLVEKAEVQPNEE